MNSFDAVVYLGLLIAVVTGYKTGLLRSAITILAYLVAMPIALWAMSLFAPRLGNGLAGNGLAGNGLAGNGLGSLPQLGATALSPLTQNSLLFFAVFLISGMVLGKCARLMLDETIGSEAGIGDRLGGAVLGAVRVGLVAITLVLIFDQLVPVDRQPAFLTGSQLRPLLSVAGQRGFRSLPPELAGTIDRLKREQRI
jgi:membrane protein required for colicin V production